MLPIQHNWAYFISSFHIHARSHFAVAIKAIGGHFDRLEVCLYDKLTVFDKNRPREQPYIEIYSQAQSNAFNCVQLVSDPSYSWSFDFDGIFQRATYFDILHAKAETIIPYIVSKYLVEQSKSLVVNCGSDFPTITLSKTSLTTSLNSI